jgi:alpha-glucosidase (family GH31 glycosyl hydrolase)
VPTFVLTLQGKLSTGTLWWKALHGKEPHYKRHNLYGLRHAELVASIVKAENKLVLSAATHTGIGAVGGSHVHVQANVRCLGGNMKTALETALGLGLAGIPLAGGGSVCGTTDDYDEDLCLRLVE